VENYSPRHRTLSRPDGDEDAPLNWKIKEMQVDDTLLVPYSVKPFGDVYNYAKSRASLWDIFLRVQKVEKGTLVTRVGSRRETRIPREELADRPDDGDWGVFSRLPNQRWHLPWKKMLPGDVFRVDKGDMKLSQMQARCYKMGPRLGKRFKPLDSPLRAPGYILVECFEGNSSALPSVIFGTVNSKLMACYKARDPAHGVDGEHDMRLSLNRIDINSLKIGERVQVDAKRVADPHRMSYVFAAWAASADEPEAEERRFAIDMYDEQIVIERVDLSMTQDEWQLEKRRRLQQAMS
jgi:hypothetical protein